MKKYIFIITLIIVALQLEAQDVMKCDIHLIRSDKLGTLTATEVSLFLRTLGEECRDNADFAEAGNEFLFSLLDKQTALTINTLNKIQSQVEKTYILEMIASPLHDLIDVKGIIVKVEKTSASPIRAEVLLSLREALKKN